MYCSKEEVVKEEREVGNLEKRRDLFDDERISSL